eukprot:scaffold342510_cov30-Prasinocladus_malaysianus.AAC.1
MMPIYDENTRRRVSLLTGHDLTEGPIIPREVLQIEQEIFDRYLNPKHPSGMERDMQRRAESAHQKAAELPHPACVDVLTNEARKIFPTLRDMPEFTIP